MPFETQPPLDEPAGVIKQTQGTLNPHPACRLELTQPGHEPPACMCRRRFSAGAAHVMGGQVLGPCAPQPSCFAGLSPDPVDFTTSKPAKCKVDSQSKAGGNRRQEPREVLQGEALTRSQ